MFGLAKNLYQYLRKRKDRLLTLVSDITGWPHVRRLLLLSVENTWNKSNDEITQLPTMLCWFRDFHVSIIMMPFELFTPPLLPMLWECGKPQMFTERDAFEMLPDIYAVSIWIFFMRHTCLRVFASYLPIFWILNTAKLVVLEWMLLLRYCHILKSLSRTPSYCVANAYGFTIVLIGTWCASGSGGARQRWKIDTAMHFAGSGIR